MPRTRGQEDSSGEPSLVVGIGSSAESPEAVHELLELLPSDAGWAYLIAGPEGAPAEGLRPGSLAGATSMAVVEALPGAPVGRNAVHLLPPDAAWIVKGSRFEVGPPAPEPDGQLPIDHLFRSLASELGPRAVGLMLCGAETDGGSGVRELRRGGGLTIAQEPSSCGRDPKAPGALDPAAFDLVLPLAEVPAAIRRFESLPLASRCEPPPEEARAPTPSGGPLLDAAGLSALGELLDRHEAFDIDAYKRATLQRRVQRRITLMGQPSLSAYLEELGRNPDERRALVRDLLIRVTDFLRDPEAFAELRRSVLRPLAREAEPGSVLRAWVAGCATGEEAYSLAIELLEAAEESGRRLSLQVFATDVDESSLRIARLGCYPGAALELVPEAWMEKHFKPAKGSGFQVRRRVRDLISFAAHDLTRDPPFSRMDLISCRNVLIYLRKEAQDRVLGAMHFALKEDGVLFLGASESTGSHRQHFVTLSKRWRLYRKAGTSGRLLADRDGRTRARQAAPSREPRGSAAERSRLGRTSDRELEESARRAILRARLPPTLVVAESGEILFLHGELRPYLRFPEGRSVLELSNLVSPELAVRTRSALAKCRRTAETVVTSSRPEGERAVGTRITASPAEELGDGVIILSFEDLPPEPKREAPEEAGDEALAGRLERELLATRDDLHDTVAELESANEELRSSTEESTSMNEELQASNEELEATSEELRSVNEELSTVNAQLREKVEQLETAHDDIANFLASTKIATLFLDEELRIKRFTPAAEELVGVGSSQLGRHVGDLVRELLGHELVTAARRVLAELVPITDEIRTAEKRWYLRRILPYRTESHRIEGVVVTFTDLTELRAATEQLAVRERQQEVIARLGLAALEQSELGHFFEQVVREVQATLEVELCKILELQPEGDRLLLRAGLGWKPGLVLEASVGASLDSQAGYTLRSSRPVLVEDLAAERRFEGPSLLIDHGVRSGVSCVIGRAEAAYGVLGAHSREPRAFTDEDANFLQAVAAVLAGALQRHSGRFRLLIEGALSQAMGETDDVDELAACLQGAMAELHGPCVVERWELGPDGRALHRRSLASSAPIGRARAESALGRTSLAADEGTVRSLLEAERAAWLTPLGGLSGLLTEEAADELGLRSGLFVFLPPTELLPAGALSFLFRAQVHADESILRSLDWVGRSLASFRHARTLERRLRTTVEDAPVGIANRSFAGRWIRVNDRLCEILQRSREELLELSFEDLTHPEDRRREEELNDALREGRLRRYRIEKRYMRPDGTAVWVHVSAAAVTSATGEPDYCVTVVEDVSKEKAAESELRESESRFRGILVHAPIPMMLVNELGDVVALSRSWTEVTGYAHEDIPTVSSWIEQAFGERAEEVRALGEGAWDDEPAPRRHELEITRRDGHRRTLAFSSIGLGRSGGHRLRLAAAVDVTQQRQFERSLVEADRQKDEFIAMLSHELRNPLAALRSATEMLAEPSRAPESLAQVQQLLERQTLQMSRLLDGLLDISRVVQGRIDVELIPVELTSLLRQVGDDFSSGSLPAGLELVARMPPEPVWVAGDPARLRQVVENLLTNAAKFTPPPGRVELLLRESEGSAVIRVTDSGEGIEPEMLGVLFEPFRQGKQSPDRSRGGLGIGLALVKRLVDLHDGSVGARSAGQGLGSEFVVQLPLTQARPSLGSAPQPRLAGRRILVIEDNADAAEAMRLLLQARGHEVEAVLRGAEGIERARAWQPEVVLCDLGLPDGMTGLDVAAALREDEATREIRLVAVSGYGRREDKERCLARGFDAHLTKPATAEDIERVMAEMVSGGPARGDGP